ncbi:MAG: DUF1926 domain-containing protein [bacterium]|nr:DUF1926 domain-containing protein [bacterium]
MSKVYLCLELHNHQPIGNFDHVIAEAYEKSYKPFLQTLLDFPHIKLSLHTSGCLLEWCESHLKDYLDLVGKLHDRGQIELIGGAFYEPVLAAIPRDDALEHFARMHDYLRRRFGAAPRGAWLPERVWEPGFAATLVDAGVEYISMDDDLFLAAGHLPEELNGYYMTEAHNGPLAMFPNHQALRYAIPFREPEATFDYIFEQADGRPNSLFLMGDDGEKFGLWPRTYKPIYEDGWLKSFFTALTDHSNDVELLTMAEARDRIRPKGRTYLPTGSYFEMGEWTLPTAARKKFVHFVHELKERDDWPQVRPFVQGGFWRGFMRKYPEANLLQKKMLRVSRKFYSLSTRKTDPSYQTQVLRGQCNCPYWHGVFGGLYLPHLRHAVWKELIQAEFTLDNLLHRGRKWVEVQPTDHDMDGRIEYLIENAYMNAYLTPHEGGALFEWDYRPRGYNILNSLTRREEPYHIDVARATVADPNDDSAVESIHDLVLKKEIGLETLVTVDRWPRRSLLDHFHGFDGTIDQFRAGLLADYADFLTGEYEMSEMFTDGVTLTRTGKLGTLPVRIAKTIRAQSGQAVLDVEYALSNLSTQEFHGPFGIEWNFALMAPNSEQHYVSLPDANVSRRPLREVAEHRDVARVLLADEHEGVAANIECSVPARLWRVPIESVSLSEGGFERVFQSVALLFSWELRLLPGEVWRCKFTAELSDK